jgi:pimeloyl-ACP methyl ester carboxylesterase
MKKILYTLTFLLWGLMRSSLTSAEQGRAALPEIQTTKVENMIDVGGRRLHACIYGQGVPAVVLLSGSRAPQTYWDPIVPAIAEKTTVVTYDRAGYGKSEMGALGCDGIQSMKDLKALLESAGIPGPWLIVGHSYGGRLARLFASLYPGSTAGLVLVDTGLWDPRLPIPSNSGAAGAKPAAPDLASPPVVQTESECNDLTWRQVEAISSYPQVPLTVITAGILQSPPGLDADALQKAKERRRLDQEALARIIPGGKHVILPEVGHDVIHLAPEAVVGAILETIRQIPQQGLSSAQSREAPKSAAQKLNDKLSVFEPFIGPTWVGSIPNDSRMGEIVLKWEVLLNGYAVRLRRTILNFDHRLETTYYWDESSGKIAFLALSNNGVSIKGFAAGQGDELISEGVQRGSDVNREVRRIYKLDKDGKLFEDDQFRESDSEAWRRTHVSIFVAK